MKKEIQDQITQLNTVMKERLTAERNSRGLTLEQAGEIAGVSKSNYRKWEKGLIVRVSSVYIKRLSDYYNINATWLMGFDTRKERDSDEEIREKREITNLLDRCSAPQIKAVKQLLFELIGENEGSKKTK